MDARLANVVIGVVSLVWLANFGAQFVVADYRPDPTIHAVFTGLVGGALALKRGRNGDHHDDRGDSQ